MQWKDYNTLEIDCGDPGEPDNGAAIFDGTLVGDVVDYECDFGFQLVGDSRRTCQLSGMWNGTVPQCERKQCNIINIDPQKILIRNRLRGSWWTW